MIDMVFGIVLSVISPSEAEIDPANMIYKGIITAGKVIEKTEKKEWKASIHEESFQIFKDAIREAGKQ